VFAGTWVALHMGWVNSFLPALAHIYPSMVAVAGLILAWRFNRSRLVLAFVVLALADRALIYVASGPSVAKGMAPTVFNAVTVFLPLNLAILSLARERGLLTWRGICRLFMILAQPALVVLAVRYAPVDLAAYLGHTFVNLPALSVIPMSQPAILFFCMALLLSATSFLARRNAIESGFFWATMSSLCALILGKTWPLSTIYFTTAGLVLVVSVVESSFSMAFRDQLTGLPARRAFDEALLKLGNTYTVAMIDIDFFKKFNDKYGHDVGDQVLKMVGARLARVRGHGKTYRYGGEEFAVLFPGKQMDEAVPYLERLRKTIDETDFVVRRSGRKGKAQRAVSDGASRKRAPITVSIGVAQRDSSSLTPHHVILAADKALYKAKKAGRNQIKASGNR
jgi:diguanylate cyclase (GGDEF)-like protein